MLDITTLDSQAAEIIAKAQERGTVEDYMFVTGFKHYQRLTEHLALLGDAISTDGVVSIGAHSVCVNPAVAAYNQTAELADSLAARLLEYIRDIE